MSGITVIKDLQAILELDPTEGETQQEFAERLFEKANILTDEEWETLAEGTQKWVNEALEASSAKKPVPLPEGIGEVIVAAPDGEPEPEAASVKPKAKAKVKNGSAKEKKAAPGKPISVKKAAKPAPAKRPAHAKAPGPKGGFSLTDKIKLTVKENPFRSGTKCEAWFSKIKDGVTVEAAIDAGAPRHHIRWAKTLGYLKIG